MAKKKKHLQNNPENSGRENAGKNAQGGAPVRSDSELNDIIKEAKKEAARGNVILAVGIIALILVAFTMSFILIAIAIVIIGIGYWFRVDARKKIKDCMTDAALLPALREVFDKVSYRADGRISDGVIRNTDMGFHFVIDKITGSDYVKAEYRGVSVEMSDIQLITILETTDEDGNIDRTERTEFKGLWLNCDFHKHFTADLLLREREGFGDKLLKRGIKTENESFNKQFYIESESEHDVFYILTPHMMEYIQAMDKKANGRTYMRFRKEGKLTLALDTGRDSFEINKIGKANAEDLRRQFIAEVKYVTDLIDELRLVKTLHQK